MPIFSDNIRAGSSNAGASKYTIDYSLRFDKDSSTYLSRTAGSPTNSNKGTWSCWFKRNKFGQETLLFGGGGGSQTNSNAEALAYMSSSDIIASNYKGGLSSCNVGWYMYGTRKLRDPSAWMHVLVSFDWTASGDSNRLKFFINGVQDTLNSCGSTGNGFQYVNKNGNTQYMGRQDQGGGPGYSDHYMAEAYFVDGTVYTPSDFTETDSDTGVIVPLNSSDVLSAITLGNNGGYYNFSDSSDLGKDHSSNSNDFTAHNFSVSAGTGNDLLEDTPTNNFCTLNPLDTWRDNSYTSDGNLKFNRSSHSFGGGRGTFAIKSGKWYYEASPSSGLFQAGWANTDFDIHYNSGDVGLAYSGALAHGIAYDDRGYWYGYTGSNPSGASDGDIIGVAFDADNDKYYFHLNGTYYGSGNPSTGANGITPNHSNTVSKTDDMMFAPYVNGENGGGFVNFGQRPFSYSIPTGYKTLCADNLPDPDVPISDKQYETRLYSGSQTGQSGFEFAPDYVWIRGRNFQVFNGNYDTVRGASKVLHSNRTDEESTNTTNLNSFTSDGYGFGSNTDVQGGGNYVSWNWNAGTSTVTNTDGSISSQVRANPTAGFSIVTYTGTGSSTTVGHGLGVKPAVIIIKCRSNTDNWMVYHHQVNNGNSPEDEYLELNAQGGDINSTVMLNDTAPTSSVVTIGSDNSVNGSSRTYVMYCWAEVEGFSRFGKYKGNGNSNGTFINTGFRPAFVMVKQANNSSSEPWVIMDNQRPAYNPAKKGLYANGYDSENDASGRYKDFVSNGFKARGTSGEQNGNNDRYIYLAFAESPFKYSRAR